MSIINLMKINYKKFDVNYSNNTIYEIGNIIPPPPLLLSQSTEYNK